MPLYTCLGNTANGACDRTGPRENCTALSTTYSGAVFATYRLAYIDDDDYYALAWCADTNQVIEHLIHTTRGVVGNHTGATVDAADNPHVLQAVRDHFAAKYADVIRKSVETDIDVNDHVVSTTTRGKNKGLSGTVTHIVRCKYNRDDWRARVTPDDGGDGRWISCSRLARPVTDEQLASATSRFLRLNSWEALMRGTVRA